MIRYSSGYKYQLREDVEVQVPEIVTAVPIRTEYMELSIDSLLRIRSGYAWDGPSGPTIDTKTFIPGSLPHDALYQMIREGLLKRSQRAPADKVLRRICLESGMWKVRAWWVYHGVRLGGGPAANPKNQKPILEAP